MGLLEGQRWLLGEGLARGKLRDEVYCQSMKQLNGNPNGRRKASSQADNILCAPYCFTALEEFRDLPAFPYATANGSARGCDLEERTTHKASDDGRDRDRVRCCLQPIHIQGTAGRNGAPAERNYLHKQSPSRFPVPRRRILALGVVKVEGIHRVPGDSDFVSELKLRIDRGNYTPDGVDDPHVLASLLKLWLCKLCDPLMHEEMYKDCIIFSASLPSPSPV
ncbi:uncharacterized protein F5891DRAFT_977275 [Suillus fuscotomentosus]|uniref:Rho-GAP domain-containing protein n=1 Tax=Suillus fuscotomentosus TaxID=1912939 RepID=A0AAD4EDV8_9AGAM|nr:uncharacterized protein F5891DRAFT_977275 [Suillus fuscotomentosus]KAG1904419.1 hypothetical protein F5891DRAFT_977275 [Suillus fuscotomentosus]